MKCPKCQQNIPENMTACPLCGAKLSKRPDFRNFADQDTGRFAAVDPSKDSYDFDLQYTLTFKDAGEIRQTIADMELGIGKTPQGELFPSEKKEDSKAYKPEHRQRSLEEMEEAAQRAALRRERRATGGKKRMGGRASMERLSRREREAAAALRSAKPRRRPSEQDAKKNRRLVFGTGVAVLVVALIIGTINLFAGMMDGGIKYPTIYTKGNQLYLYYNKKPQLLSTNFISAYAAEDAATSASSKKAADPKRYQKTTATEKQLIHVSADGLHTYFMENIDLNTGRGDLVYYRNDAPKTRTLLSISVYYKLVIGKDGQSVLFLRKTDDTGYHGELCYWNPSMKEAVSIEQDICSGNFLFSQDGQSVLYIKNFNPGAYSGDLCIRGLSKDAETEARQLDEKVSFVFGTTTKGDVYLYAKEYDMQKGTYNLYSMKENEKAILRAEKAFLPPVLLTKSEGAYVYSNYRDNFQTISYLDFATGTGNVVTESATRIERLRMDEMALIYSKSYAETDKSDYYMATATQNASQKVANAVVNLKEPMASRSQFDISDDFSRAAYISSYDEENGRGALMTMSIVNGYVGTEKRISDDAYGCDVSADGAVVRFAAGYNRDLGTVNLIAYASANTVTLKEEVCAGAFTYDAAGALMVYATDVQSAPINSGNIEAVTTKGKVRKIEEGVSSYGLKKDGKILLLKREGEGAKPAGKLYFCDEKGKGMKLMDEGVSGALFY